MGTKGGRNDDLNELIDSIPKTQPLYIGGDFNARLHCRPADEREQIGPHVYGRGELYADNTCAKTQENRDLFLAFVKGNSLHVANSWFQKPRKKLITYREVGTLPHDDPEDATKFAQLDYLLCRPRFKNSILNLESDMKFWQHSNHYPLIAHIRVRLSHKEYVRRDKPNYSDLQAMQQYTTNIQAALDARDQTHPAEWPELAALIMDERDRLPTHHDTLWRPYISDYTKTLIASRDQLATEIYRRPEAPELLIRYNELKRDVKRHCRLDRQQRSEEWITGHHSDKMRWRGVMAIRKPYAPQPYELNDIHGNPVGPKYQAEAMAEYLSTRQWAPAPDEAAATATISTRSINRHLPEYELSPITVEYIAGILTEFRMGRAPGPDSMEVELLKNLPQEGIQIITDHVNHWFHHAETPMDLTTAKIAALFKKGDYTNPENYRPISLLNTIYKVMARALRDR